MDAIEEVILVVVMVGGRTFGYAAASCGMVAVIR